MPRGHCPPHHAWGIVVGDSAARTPDQMVRTVGSGCPQHWDRLLASASMNLSPTWPRSMGGTEQGAGELGRVLTCSADSSPGRRDWFSFFPCPPSAVQTFQLSRAACGLPHRAPCPCGHRRRLHNWRHNLWFFWVWARAPVGLEPCQSPLSSPSATWTSWVWRWPPLGGCTATEKTKDASPNAEPPAPTTVSGTWGPSFTLRSSQAQGW